MNNDLLLYYTYSTLKSLILFLKEKDTRFEGFYTIESVALTSYLTEEDTDAFYLSIEKCLDLSIREIPTIEEFTEIVVKNGGKNFKVVSIYKMLRAYTYTLEGSFFFYSTAQSILNNPNNKFSFNPPI